MKSSGKHSRSGPDPAPPREPPKEEPPPEPGTEPAPPAGVVVEFTSGLPDIEAKVDPTVGTPTDVCPKPPAEPPIIDEPGVPPPISGVDVPMVGVVEVPMLGGVDVPMVGDSEVPIDGAVGVPIVGESDVPIVGVPIVVDKDRPKGSVGVPIVGDKEVPIVGVVGMPIVGVVGVPMVGIVGVPIVGAVGVPMEGSVGVPIAGVVGAPTVGVPIVGKGEAPLPKPGDRSPMPGVIVAWIGINAAALVRANADARDNCAAVLSPGEVGRAPDCA